MVVPVTCKNEEDPIKNKGAKVVKTSFIDIFVTQGQLIPFGDGILLKFKLVQAFMVCLVTRKNDESIQK